MMTNSAKMLLIFLLVAVIAQFETASIQKEYGDDVPTTLMEPESTVIGQRVKREMNPSIRYPRCRNGFQYSTRRRRCIRSRRRSISGRTPKPGNDVTEESRLACGFDDKLLQSSNSPNQDSHGLVLHRPWYTWKDGQVPYYFKGSVTVEDKKLIREIMDEIEQKTCFKYIPHNTRPAGHHLEIQIDLLPCQNRFSAYVKPLSSTQVLFHSYYQLTCSSMDTRLGILHELMHAFGIMHTHRRLDRDQFITVHKQNIQPNATSQYEPCTDCDMYPGMPYDCDSIMHYGFKTFAKKGVETMSSKDPSKCKLLRSGPAFELKEPSKNDWQLLKNIAGEVCEQRPGPDGQPCTFFGKCGVKITKMIKELICTTPVLESSINCSVATMMGWFTSGMAYIFD